MILSINSADFFEADGTVTKFYLLEYPQWLARRCIDGSNAKHLLSGSRAHMIIYGEVKLRMLDGKESHVLEIDGAVRHAPIGPEVRQAFGNAIREAIPSRVFLSRDNDLLAFVATSEIAELAARYIVAMAAMLSGDFAYAEQLLLSVEQRLRTRQTGIGQVGPIARRLPARFHELYGLWLEALFDRYLATRERAFLVEIERVVNATLLREPKNYQALLSSAICHFSLRRDVASAKRAARACRPMRDQIWRYSFAFLLAYEGNTKKAREEYKMAFKGPTANPTVAVQVEAFIHLVLQDEPDKVQLHFFSGLLNLYVKEDKEGALKDLTAFLAAKGSERFPEERTEAEEHLRALPN